MNPLLELSAILNTSNKRKTGRVVSVSGEGVHAIVDGRLQIFSKIDATQYRIGDTVSTQGEVILGRRRIKPGIKTYVI